MFHSNTYCTVLLVIKELLNSYIRLEIDTLQFLKENNTNLNLPKQKFKKDFEIIVQMIWLKTPINYVYLRTVF